MWEDGYGEDHSVFMAFAPKENPKIAIACIVENAGFGGTWAAPIVSLMIEQYINGEISNEFKLNRILEKNFLEQEAEADVPAPAINAAVTPSVQPIEVPQPTPEVVPDAAPAVQPDNYPEG